MAAQFIVNADDRVVFSHSSGPFTFEVAADHMNRLSSDPLFKPHFRQVMDFREVTEVQLTAGQIRQLALRPVFGPDSRRAFLVASDVQFGLARMFGTYRSFEGEPSIGVFRTIREASNWTGVAVETVEAGLAHLKALYEGV